MNNSDFEHLEKAGRLEMNTNGLTSLLRKLRQLKRYKQKIFPNGLHEKTLFKVS